MLVLAFSFAQFFSFFAGFFHADAIIPVQASFHIHHVKAQAYIPVPAS